MNRVDHWKHACLAATTLLLCGAQLAPAAEPSKRPDIILIVADNLGHGDLSCYGCPDIQTPNIDRLATEGVRFSNFYANGPECSPTRTALQDTARSRPGSLRNKGSTCAC